VSMSNTSGLQREAVRARRAAATRRKSLACSGCLALTVGRR
jgi:hypothetical protein